MIKNPKFLPLQLARANSQPKFYSRQELPTIENRDVEAIYLPCGKHLSLLLCTCTLLGKKYCLDVGEDATLGDGHSSEQLVQLLVVPNVGRD